MHRVVIVGCGFAGLFAAKALRGAQALRRQEIITRLPGREWTDEVLPGAAR